MASARRRTSARFRLAAIWVGEGDIKARVGLRCKVKLPRRGSSAAARGRRRERAAGWRLLRCVHSLASLWRRGRRERSKDYRPGLGPARNAGVCMCVRGCRSPPIRPCFFILRPQSDWQLLLASSSLRRTESDSFLRIPRIPGLLAAFRGGFLDKRLAPFKIEGETSLKSLRFFFFSFPRGNVLLNSASRCIRCLKMALKFTSACFPQGRQNLLRYYIAT